MISLERIVRPFQTPDITPPKRVLSARNEQAPANLTLALGKTGTAKNLGGSYSWTMSRYMDQRLKETRR